MPQPGDWNIPHHLLNRQEERPHEEIRDQASRNQVRFQQRYAPVDVPPILILRVGQPVMVKAMKPRRNAFHPIWIGPYPVTRRISDEVYEINKQGKLSEMHINDLRPIPNYDPVVNDDFYQPQLPVIPEEPPEPDPDQEDQAGAARIPRRVYPRIHAPEQPIFEPPREMDIPRQPRTIPGPGLDTPSSSGSQIPGPHALIDEEAEPPVLEDPVEYPDRVHTEMDISEARTNERPPARPPVDIPRRIHAPRRGRRVGIIARPATPPQDLT